MAGSRASARSQSPGGSIVALSDRLSLASGSLGGPSLIQAAPLTPQQLGVMGNKILIYYNNNININYYIFNNCIGMESLEIVINYWEDALTAYDLPNTSGAEESEFCREIQNLLDIAYTLQDQSELLFLDQRSVLFREENNDSEKTLTNANRSTSDPNFDSAESFASALDQVADLREFEDFSEAISDVDQYQLYQSAIKHFEEHPIPYRMMRTELVNCSSDLEYLAKLHCVRLAFQYLFKV